MLTRRTDGTGHNALLLYVSSDSSLFCLRFAIAVRGRLANANARRPGLNQEEATRRDRMP